MATFCFLNVYGNDFKIPEINASPEDYYAMLQSIERAVEWGKNPTIVFPDGKKFTLTSYAGEGSRSIIFRTSTGTTLRMPISRGPYQGHPKWRYEHFIDVYVDGQKILMDGGVDVPELYSSLSFYYAESEDVGLGMNLTDFFTDKKFNNVRSSPEYMARLNQSLKDLSRQFWRFEKISDFHQGQIYCQPDASRCRLIDFDANSKHIKSIDSLTPFKLEKFDNGFPLEWVDELIKEVKAERERQVQAAISQFKGEFLAMAKISTPNTLVDNLDFVTKQDALNADLSDILKLDHFSLDQNHSYEIPLDLMLKLLGEPNLNAQKKEVIVKALLKFITDGYNANSLVLRDLIKINFNRIENLISSTGNQSFNDLLNLFNKSCFPPSKVIQHYSGQLKN